MKYIKIRYTILLLSFNAGTVFFCFSTHYSICIHYLTISIKYVYNLPKAETIRHHHDWNFSITMKHFIHFVTLSSCACTSINLCLVSRLVTNDGISTSDEISAQTFFANDYSSAQTFFANVYPRNINVDSVIVDGGIG